MCDLQWFQRIHDITYYWCSYLCRKNVKTHPKNNICYWKRKYQCFYQNLDNSPFIKAGTTKNYQALIFMCVAFHTTLLHVLIVHNRIVFLCLVHIKNTATSNSLLKTHIFIFYAHSKRKERHQSDLHLNRIVWFQSKQAYSNKMSIQSILCFDLIHSCYKLIV